MRKNQKYTKEEMYSFIASWKESELSQSKFCAREKISVKVFSYWLGKYRRENILPKPGVNRPAQVFIPVKVSGGSNKAAIDPGQIDISFPNGVRLSCPAGIDVHQLKTLINF